MSRANLQADDFVTLRAHSADLERQVEDARQAAASEASAAGGESNGIDQLRAEHDLLHIRIKAYDRDRQLMAYEIHDGLLQYLAGALWQIEGVLGRTELDSQSRKMLSEAQQWLRQAMAEARCVLSGLRPPLLDEEGILAALDRLAAENSEPGKLQIAVDRTLKLRRLDPLLEGAIFRIVQESLGNVRKHSQAKHAQVRLAENGDRLLLSIQDDGQGFSVDAVPPDRLGLQGIRKRAQLLGGTAKIESAIGEGTRMNVDLPLLPYQNIEG